MENRNGLIADLLVVPATGLTEREAALAMLDRTLVGTKRITLGGDKGYDVEGFIGDLRDRNVTPHIAAKDNSRLEHGFNEMFLYGLFREGSGEMLGY